MATLQIPPESMPVLLQLVTLPADVIEKLKETLRKQPPALSLQVLASRVAAADIGITSTHAVKLIGLLASLYSAEVSQKISTEEFAEEVCATVKAAGVVDETVVDWARFTLDLKELLSLDLQLGITSKALAVMLEHHRTFRTARILTDLRPVFAEDVAEIPKAAVIIHTLKILYREHNVAKEFFVALDAADLRQLKKVLERASVKEETVRSLIRKMDIECLDPE